MIGTYVKHPVYGVGKVIKINGTSELVFFFEANKGLHDGGLYPGSCKDHHGWWYAPCEIEAMEFKPSLELLIKKRKRKKKKWTY